MPARRSGRAAHVRAGSNEKSHRYLISVDSSAEREPPAGVRIMPRWRVTNPLKRTRHPPQSQDVLGHCGCNCFHLCGSHIADPHKTVAMTPQEPYKPAIAQAEWHALPPQRREQSLAPWSLSSLPEVAHCHRAAALALPNAPFGQDFVQLFHVWMPPPWPGALLLESPLQRLQPHLLPAPNGGRLGRRS